MIQTQEMVVTPELAHTWLEEHYKRLEAGKFLQRPVVPSTVNRYAADMLQGAWLLCPQPLAWDEAGNLLDGQHRLEAIMKSKVTVKMMISTGWPATGNGRLTTMDVIDRGKPRTVGNQLHLHGYKHANNYASSIAVMGRVVHHACSSVMSLPGCLYVLDQLDMKSHIDRIMARTTDAGDFRGRTIGVLAYYHTAAPRKAEEFADDIFNFTAEKSSPTQSYMRWVKNNVGRPTDDHLKALCACLRAWNDNVSLSAVRIHVETVAWLAATNPKLRDNIRKALPRTS